MNGYDAGPTELRSFDECINVSIRETKPQLLTYAIEKDKNNFRKGEYIAIYKLRSEWIKRSNGKIDPVRFIPPEKPQGYTKMKNELKLLRKIAERMSMEILDGKSITKEQRQLLSQWIEYAKPSLSYGR